jgi:hypothetical protein
MIITVVLLTLAVAALAPVLGVDTRTPELVGRR